MSTSSAADVVDDQVHTGQLLSLRGLGKTFADSTQALSNITLDIGWKEFVSLVGPSGCGKSTILRIAAGLETPTSGECVVQTTKVGFVFQDATLLPWRNVFRNIELLIELDDVEPGERKRRVHDIMQLVDLVDSARKYPRQLSGGMKMRTSLARSLVSNPDLFLFDEPFSALDEFTRERLNDELLALFAQRKFAALFVTHSIAEAVYMSSRVVVMSPRPGTIARVITVPYSYPRRHDIRYTPQFAEICGQVSRALRQDSQ
ncbi:MAG: ABC transporter ATP-binding protein [Ilumatobacteraceae bacterium]